MKRRFESEVLRCMKTVVGMETEADCCRDEQDREARQFGGRTCFWRSLVMLTFR
jgi:hypothetical protein